MDGWTRSEWLTLQLGPVWVLSALVGRSQFDPLEQEAFWSSVEDAAIGQVALPWQLMRAIVHDREWLFDEFELDGRPIVAGLSSVARVLERTDPESSAETRQAILRVGAGVARARGPFGARVTSEDAQTLLLVAQLLETSSETAENNPLNSPVAL
jgi:hypothetical protein